MEATVRILINDIDKQVVRGKNRFIKDCFYKVWDEIYKPNKPVTDYDIVWFKNELEYRYSIFILWSALDKFFGEF
jgi:hypothetical protein